MAEGEELPPVVIPLEGNDEAFLDMLVRDEDALAAFAERMNQILGDGFAVAGETAAEELPAALAEAGQQAAAAFDDELTPEIEAAIRELNAPIVESLAQAGADGGEAFAQGVEAGVEAAQQALTGAEAELAEWRSSVEEAVASGATMPPQITQTLAEVDAGALSAAEAVTRLEASEEQAGATAVVSSREFEAMAVALNTVGVSSGLTLDQLRAAAVTFEDAATVADRYGISEAQLAISTQALADAQAHLAEQNANLIQVYGTMSAAGTDSLTALQGALKDVADAQATVTAQAVSQVEAMNAVNLAVIQNETAIMNDQVAFSALESVSQATGIELDTLTQQLEEGSFAALDQAAANAQATIKAELLSGAQQKLAAANITLVDTWRQLAEGAEVSAAAQKAAIDSVAKAQSEVSALDGSAASAAAAGGSFMSGGAGMLLWNLPFMIPMITQMFGNSGQAAQQYQQQLQSLGSSIAQDGNMIGANTEAALANQLAYQGLGDALSRYGITLTQATEYAAGVSAVQQQVTASLNDTTAAYEIAAQTASSSRPQGTVGGTVEGIQAQQAEDARKALGSLAQAAQTALEKQNEVTAATLATEKATGVFTSQVTAAKLAMDQQAESAAVNASATLEWLAEVTPGTDKYNQAIWESLTAMKAQAQQADINAAAQREYLGIIVPGSQAYTNAVNDQATALEFNARMADINAAAQRQYLAELLPGTRQYTAAVGDQETALEMNARTAAIAAAAQLQYLQTLVPGTQAYTQALDTQHASLLANAAQSALTTMAQLNLGNATDQFQIELTGLLDEYQQTTGAASGYASVLTALNGTMNTALSAAAGFTIALNNVTTAAQQNGTSLDINTDKGALNIQAFTGVASAAQKAADGIYQSEYQTKGAVTAFNDANKTLAQEKQAFIDAADKAGFNKTMVKELADQLYQLPPDVKATVHVDVDTKKAVEGMNALVYGIDSSTAFLNVQTNTSGVQANPHSGIKYNASGGPAFANIPQVVGDAHGGVGELFVPNSNGYVFPSVDQGLAALAGAYGGGGSQGTTVVNVYLDGELVAGGVRHSSRYYANRNSTTGFN